MAFSVNWNNCTLPIPINYVNFIVRYNVAVRDTREIDLRLNHSARLLMIKRSEITRDALRCKHLTPKGETYFTWNYVYVYAKRHGNVHLVDTINTLDSLFNSYY